MARRKQSDSFGQTMKATKGKAPWSATNFSKNSYNIRQAQFQVTAFSFFFSGDYVIFGTVLFAATVFFLLVKNHEFSVLSFPFFYDLCPPKFELRRVFADSLLPADIAMESFKRCRTQKLREKKRTGNG